MEQLALMIVGACFLLGAVIRALSTKCRYMLKPPMHIQLVPVDDSAKGRFADPHRRELDSFGFGLIGTFQVREMPGVTLVAFTQASQGLCAVVYRHPLAGVFVDVGWMTEDDRGFTATNAPAGGNLDPPPGRTKAFLPKASLCELFDRALSDRPAGPYRRLDSSNFARVFEQEYAREMKWRQGRGGVTEAEVRREAHAMGIQSEKTIEKATERLQKQYRETSEPGVR